MGARRQPIARESFQVDLKGMVDVLSHHLYSSPTVFVRELLQNSVDAIEARRARTPRHRGVVRFEVDSSTRTIIVSDNGVGLSRQQISEFLSRVGASSKRTMCADEVERFIGQFGIGLLSCFMVADELLILTRSAERGASTLEWRASADGTYAVRKTRTKLAVGTRVVLQLRPDAAEYAEFQRLAGLLRRYGQYLEQEVTVEETGQRNTREYTSRARGLWEVAGDDRDDALETASWQLGFRPLDVVAIDDAELGLQAAAYVLPEPAQRAAEGAHRLYLKRMFVADTDVKVTPRWASFVRCVINSTRLSPTASREAVCEDDVFRATRRVIGARLSSYLHDLARTQRPLLTQILIIHDDALRQLARDDEEFFRLVIDLLPFETSRGPVPFGAYRAENTTVRLAPTVDLFRSCAAIAAAQGITVFNGGYANHTELLERAVALDPSLSLEIVDPRALLGGLSVGDGEDVGQFDRLLAAGQEALAPFGCGAMLRSFEPADIPAVFAEGAEQSLARMIESSYRRCEGFWKDVLRALDEGIGAGERGAFLCLNTRCPLLVRLASVADGQLLKSAVRVLYVEALLLGRQPLTDQETCAFTAALGALIDVAA
jgi:molecular chaperone HtpG